MDGWQHSTVVAILNNPRCTGHAVYGRWQKVEELPEALLPTPNDDALVAFLCHHITAGSARSPSKPRRR